MCISDPATSTALCPDSIRPILVITGAAGFIGSATVRRGVEIGFPVWAVSRRPQVAAVGVTAVHLDDYAKLQPPPGSILIHLAEPPAIADAADAGDRHVAGVTRTVIALLAHPWRHVVYASSIAVYGDRDLQPHRPAEQVLPRDPYSRAKVACEAAVLAAGGTVLRLSNVFGPNTSPGTIIADLLAQLNSAGPMRVRNCGPERDFLWVDDAAAGLVAAAERPVTGVFNLASGQTMSIQGLAQLVLQAAGQSSRLILPAFEPTQSRIAADISDTIQTFGWKPVTSLETGIYRLVSNNR